MERWKLLFVSHSIPPGGKGDNKRAVAVWPVAGVPSSGFSHAQLFDTLIRKILSLLA